MVYHKYVNNFSLKGFAGFFVNLSNLKSVFTMYNKIKAYYVSNYFLMIPFCIIVLTCTGSLGAYYISSKGMNSINFVQLMLCVFGSMSYLTAVLGQLKKEITFTVLGIALLLEIFLVVVNLIF